MWRPSWAVGTGALGAVATVLAGRKQVHCAPKPARPKEAWDPPLPLASYNTLVASYDTKEKAYEKLGVRLRVKGCKATAIRCDPNHSFLHCKHWAAVDDPCGWKAVLQKIVRTGKWELYSNGVEHNKAETNRTGTIGVHTLEQREKMMEKLQATPIVRPRGWGY